MEWHEDRAPKAEPSNDTSRVLIVTSGNAQLFSDKVKNDSSSRNLCALEHLDQPDYVGQNFPAPTTTLRSNDHQTQVQETLRIRKLRMRYARAKRCWIWPAYLKYLSRPRKDIDKKTKEIIWDEDVERAFRNAVVNIPAMGKSKRSQHGKQCGRNELFMEWIVQETGKERVRKQISSHLQVFDKIFANVPEWFSLNKISKKTAKPGSVEDTGSIQDHEFEYYRNSIADMVRDWKKLSKILPDHLEPGDKPISDIPSSDLFPLGSIDFDMWVSQPDDINRVLHRYTKMRSVQSTSSPEPLENLSDWRIRWPDLVPVLEGALPEDHFDIVLLEADCELMPEFPPQRSKLGISLELKFLCSSLALAFSNEYSSWSCISRFYQRGKLEKTFRHNECQSLGSGGVRPPFESKWWAEMFSGLTERRMRAQDSNNDATIAVADESARNYLHNLTVMQQISMGPHHSGLSGDAWNRPGSERSRMTVLLWSFSQGSGGVVGRTSWRKLLPPPVRANVISPLPSAAQLGLPPFNMDTTMDIPPNEGLFELNDNFTPAPLTSNMYQGQALGSSYPDEFTATDPQNVFKFGNVHYEDMSHITSLGATFPDALDFQPSTQQLQLPGLQFSEEAINCIRPALSNQYPRAYQPQHGAIYDHHIQHMDPMHEYQEGHEYRRPLLSFDMNTHKQLQIQLERSIPRCALNDGRDLEDTERSTLQTIENASQDSTSAIEDLLLQKAFSDKPELQDNDRDQVLQSQRVANNDAFQANALPGTGPVLLAPTAIRPPLLHHHSYAGLSHFSSDYNTSLTGTSRYGVASLLENLEAGPEEVAGGVQLPSLPGAIHGLEITRPHTQPPPVAALARESMYGGTDCAYATSQPQPLTDSIDSELEITPVE